MYCRFCGAAIPDDSRYCPKCGESLYAHVRTAVAADGQTATIASDLDSPDVNWPLRKDPFEPDPDFFDAASDDGSWWQSEEGYTYAGWWQRVLANLIDSLICLAIVAVAALLVAAPVFTLPGYALMLCGPWIYYAYFGALPIRQHPASSHSAYASLTSGAAG